MKRLTLLRLTTLVVFTAMILGARSVAYATTTYYGVYDVVIQGVAQGNQFQRVGVLYVVPTISPQGTQNGVNPVDVWLGSGAPATASSPGAIWLGTNSAFIGGQAALDMAYVSVDSQTGAISVRPDPNMSATGSNIFNAYGGLTAQIYQIFDGQMQLAFQDNGQTVVGVVDVLGTGAIYHSNTEYYAQVRGTARPAPGVRLAPTSLAFGEQQMGTSSAVQTVTLTNSGGHRLRSPASGSLATRVTSCMGAGRSA